MTQEVRYRLKTIMDGRYHVITAPDVKGLFITATKVEVANRGATSVLQLIEPHKASRAAEKASRNA